MSSDLYVFDNFFTDSSFSPFCESSIDVLQANNQNPVVDESSSIDQLAHDLLSYSPPSHLLENLSLYQTNSHLQPLAANGYQDFACMDTLVDVKNEESLVGFNISSSSYDNQILQEQLVAPHSYSGVENVAKYMQRSHSSNSFDGNKPGFLFQPGFDSLLVSPNFYNQALSSPENSFFAGQMRRASSTGDLQNTRTPHNNKTPRSFSSPLATESSSMEEANFRVGRYSAEERKEKIMKYRAKRNQRNFNKTIKYACRKTLADSRPRIRGRFARNDEAGEILKAACSAKDEDEDELWLDGLQEEEDDGAMRGGGGPFISSFGQHQHQHQHQHQLQYYGCY